MKVVRLQEFTEWLTRIRDFNHFGAAKDLGGGLAELKWKNGRRVYFAITLDNDGRVIILILGGTKNGQNKDINKARKILAQNQE